MDKIPVAVTHRTCPKCGLLEIQKMIDMLIINPLCRCCGEHRLSKFQPLILPVE